MVLSLKPFGCMPSTQSDGVQSAVADQFKDMIYLPIETSGEGEINAHSRVQMALGEAQGARPRRSSSGRSTATGQDARRDPRATSRSTRSCSSPLYHVPRRAGRGRHRRELRAPREPS